jgi:uncharacterized coiled-coil protein SlyX
MSYKDDIGIQSDTIKRLEKELRDSKNRCEKLQMAMKYFIQAMQDIREAREEIRLLKAIMNMMKDKANE